MKIKKPKVIRVRGFAFEEKFDNVDERISPYFGDLKVVKELDFNEAYKTNKRGCHFDVFLGPIGTIIFRPFHYIDGLDDFCFFPTQHCSMNKRHAIEFFQWSSKRQVKIDLYHDSQQLLKASQKKQIRAKGNKSLIKNNDVYETANFYLKYIVGFNIEELTSEHKIYRCERPE